MFLTWWSQLHGESFLHLKDSPRLEVVKDARSKNIHALFERPKRRRPLQKTRMSFILHPPQHCHQCWTWLPWFSAHVGDHSQNKCGLHEREQRGRRETLLDTFTTDMDNNSASFREHTSQALAGPRHYQINAKKTSLYTSADFRCYLDREFKWIYTETTLGRTRFISPTSYARFKDRGTLLIAPLVTTRCQGLTGLSNTPLRVLYHGFKWDIAVCLANKKCLLYIVHFVSILTLRQTEPS